MTSPDRLAVWPIGIVESVLTDTATAPKQGDEGAPDAWLVFEPDVIDGLSDLEVGDDVLVFTWLARARLDVLTSHSRGDPTAAARGVFSTRFPHRPNPIGLHRATVREIDGHRILVGPIEAINNTPVLDIKPVIDLTFR